MGPERSRQGSGRIEDYAIIGDTQTAALVDRRGSIDWMCMPRFDSPACFAALLGTNDHGYWLLAPASTSTRTERRYVPGTLVLETDHTNDQGRVRVTDCMPIRGEWPDVVRVVEGLEGSVSMRMELVVRFDYGSAVPWVRRVDGILRAVAGPDSVELCTSAAVRGEGLTTVAEFEVRAGERVPFVLTWRPSYAPSGASPDADRAVDDTVAWWRAWSDRGSPAADREIVRRSLITLKALTHAPTGGIVAAATTSLPEDVGGSRNWDYRYCWIRDATFTLYALLLAGYEDEAFAWRDWLLRAAAGAPAQLQMLYGPAGERRLTEVDLESLPGYEGSAPVRIGNAAIGQFQLDVYGEVMDCLHQARRHAGEPDADSWNLQTALIEFLEGHWDQPDEGIWEVRSGREHFTHSKVMAWVAADRAVKAVEQHGLAGPLDRWRDLRDAIRRDVDGRGFDPDRNTFTRTYGGSDVDASLLMLPLVGFCDATDSRMTGTVEAIERELLVGGFVRRYAIDPSGTSDGVSGDEGVFLPCSFWLADNYILQGRADEGRELFERLVSIANDVGLLSEEYDPSRRRLLGNFPQAFTHVALVNTAHNLGRAGGPAQERGEQRAGP